MEDDLKLKIQASGYKYKYLSERLKITNNYFSMCLHGTRNMSNEKQIKLRKILHV